jgi:hypothetical protein
MLSAMDQLSITPRTRRSRHPTSLRGAAGLGGGGGGSAVEHPVGGRGGKRKERMGNSRVAASKLVHALKASLTCAGAGSIQADPLPAWRQRGGGGGSACERGTPPAKAP